MAHSLSFIFQNLLLQPLFLDNVRTFFAAIGLVTSAIGVYQLNEDGSWSSLLVGLFILTVTAFSNNESL